MKKTILIIEDDPDIAQLILMHVQAAAYSAIHADSGEQGLLAFERAQPDLVVLDLMLPGIDGLEVCKRIRKQTERTPVLMLTAKTTELDRVLGLELGADDYLSKPFSVVELMARIKALLRRVDALSQPQDSNKEGDVEQTELAFDSIKIDVKKHKVYLKRDKGEKGEGESEVELTAREFDLLFFLASSPGQVYSRTQLLDSVWGYDHDGYEHTVNTHINRLRIKIESDPAKPKYVQTVWGVGYKFAEISQAKQG